MSNKITKQEALDYHKFPRSGKLSIATTTNLGSQRDLSMAYTPGVAHPCEEIAKNPNDAYDYTSKRNLVAIISNGTAVLGLGDIGALASKPVMEGKAVLFKKFADVDAFDIEVNEKDVDKFVEIVKAISPTFGGINLEDIKAPECFEIERRLKAETDIPVMHDDQHGTAIITSAALINALELTQRKAKDTKVIVLGAGAAAIACSKLYKELGIENIYMFDSKGVIHKNRTDLNKYKLEFAVEEDISKEEAFKDADMVLALSKPGTFTKEHVALMHKQPIIFALANPTPELFPEDIREVRPNAIIGTGRSDFNNQINNVLGFPFIFRGALDVRATHINIPMKLAAAKAIAHLAKQEIPSYLQDLFPEKLEYGKEYVIPKPFDKRLLIEVSAAVAKTAFETGVSRVKIFDEERYRKKLTATLYK